MGKGWEQDGQASEGKEKTPGANRGFIVSWFLSIYCLFCFSNSSKEGGSMKEGPSAALEGRALVDATTL